MKSILLVGCGNIGSRHLQGILKIKLKLNITVVDPSIKSINIAKKRTKEIDFGSNHNIFWKNSLTEINEIYDLCIISTNSNIRYSLISKLLKKQNKKFLIEKVVCQSKSEYIKLISLIKKSQANCWVNTSRRTNEFYKIIKNKKSNHPIFLNISGGDLGLGSNSIHFLDLFCWICNSTKIKLDGSNIIPKLYQNKRGNKFVEFAGIISGNIKNKFFITIASLPNSTAPIKIDFIGNDFQIYVNETEQSIYQFKNKKITNIPFKTDVTSQTTTKIVYDILQKNNCELSTVEFLAELHYELFRIFNNHIYMITKQKLEKCPIT